MHARRTTPLLTLAMSVAFQFPAPAAAADFYVDPASGNDAAAGTRQTSAWKTLARASEARLSPGDRLLLKSGGQFEGMLKLAARGTQESPITITAYDGDAPPKIDGRGAEACVQLVNPSHVIVRGLSLTNPDGHYGIQLTAKDAGELSGVLIENATISDVYRPAWSDVEEACGNCDAKYYGAINAYAFKGRRASWWNGLVIRRCTMDQVGTCGVSIGSDYPLHEKLRKNARGRTAPAHPHLGVMIEENTFRDIARDGAIVRQCDGAVFRHNDVVRTGRVSMSNGIWFWDCQNSAIRYNVGSECGARNRADGGPFSVDYYCKDCRIENNYSHDNEGPAFMIFGNDQTGTGTVIRGNVSYNDGTGDTKPGFAAVSMISTVTDAVVEGNVVIAGDQTRVLIGHHDWGGVPQSVTYRGNIFVGNGRAPVEASVLSGGRFESNLFLNVPSLPEGVASDPETLGTAFVDAMDHSSHVRQASGRP